MAMNVFHPLIKAPHAHLVISSLTIQRIHRNLTTVDPKVLATFYSSSILVFLLALIPRVWRICDFIVIFLDFFRPLHVHVDQRSTRHETVLLLAINLLEKLVMNKIKRCITGMSPEWTSLFILIPRKFRVLDGKLKTEFLISLLDSVRLLCITRLIGLRNVSSTKCTSM